MTTKMEHQSFPDNRMTML